MSKRYWTSDTHFSHAQIAVYESRPWLDRDDVDPVTGRFKTTEAALATARRMNAGLAKSINMRLSRDDRVVHVGDFGTKGRAKGVEGLREPADAMLASLTGRWTLLRGNHDIQNNVKCVADYLVVGIGNLQAFVSHWPLDAVNVYDDELLRWVSGYCHVVIHGHVHSMWRTKWIKIFDKQVLHINVGVDVNKFAPVGDDEVIGLYEKEKREQDKARNVAPV